MFDHLLVVEMTNSHSTGSPSLVYMHAYDRTVDCLTNTTNLLRKLNLHVQTILQTELGGDRNAAVAPAPAVNQMYGPIRAMLPDTAAAAVATRSDDVGVVDLPLTIADMMPDLADRSYYSVKCMLLLKTRCLLLRCIFTITHPTPQINVEPPAWPSFRT